MQPRVMSLTKAIAGQQKKKQNKKHTHKKCTFDRRSPKDLVTM